MHDYREQLHVPLAWWLLAVPTVLIFGATLYAGLPEPWPIIIMAGLTAGCAAMLISLGMARLEIGDGGGGGGGRGAGGGGGGGGAAGGRGAPRRPGPAGGRAPRSGTAGQRPAKG